MLTAKTPFKILLVLALLLGVAACGDDDGADSGSASASGSGSGSVAEDEDAAADDFCGSLETFNAAIFETEIEDDASEADITAAHETLDPLWTDVESSAPDEHGDAIDELGATIDALGEGDAEPFNEDATAETYFGLLAEVIDDCVDEVVDVSGVDYAFEGVPETFPAGKSGIRFSNDTENDEQHEFIIFKKADGETRTAEEILNDPAAQEQGPGEFSGAVFATPGVTSGAFLDLTPGDYIAVCFIPVGGGEEGPPHFTQGMVAEFGVA